MEIGFRDKKIKELCENRAKAIKQLGTNCAKKLSTRLSELEAAADVSELVAGHPHPLTGDRAGEFALDLSGGFRITFSPNHEPCPTLPDGGIDWSKVTIISIEFIGDYHD